VSVRSRRKARANRDHLSTLTCCAGRKWYQHVQKVFQGVWEESTKPFLQHSDWLGDWGSFMDSYPDELDDLSEQHRPPFCLPLIDQGRQLAANQGRASPIEVRSQHEFNC
jgi:hypothetical protein